MFNEKSDVWIKILRYFAVFIFGIEAIGAAVLGISGLTEAICLTDFAFLDGMILAVLGYIVAFGHLVANMLVLQFLNNVNAIRQSLVN